MRKRGWKVTGKRWSRRGVTERRASAGKKCQIRNVELEDFHILRSKLMVVIVERHTKTVFVNIV